MKTRTDIVSDFYNQVKNEDTRLIRSRHGQLEHAVTMNYIHRYAAPGARVLEVGAGTGRYSIALANEGMEVTALELVESNLEVLRQNGRGIDRLTACQGDAVDLSRFADETFDVTLVLGPLYLFLIGIVSAIWAGLPYFEKLRIEKGVPYTACFVESWASRWGERVTGEAAFWG